MNSNKPSRRKFIGMSFILTGIPSIISSLIPSSGNAMPALEKLTSGFEAVPDLERIKELLRQKNPLKWLFTGDSITAGVEHTHGYRSYPEIFGERIRWEMRRPRDIVINTAISGNVTQNILDDFNWRIEQFKPEIVSLMIGTNDCARKEMTTTIFENNLNSLLDKIRETGAIPILHTPNIIITEYAPERAGLLEYVNVIQETAEKKNIILVDNYPYWEDTMKNHSEINVFKEWLNDPLHPNGTGHQEIARLLFKELSIFNPNDATCGGKYYEGKH
jgi:lysophospholipase L1-like esterase